MAKFKNDLGYEVELPTLGIVAQPDDVIDAPDDFEVAGFSLVSSKSAPAPSTVQAEVVIPPATATVGE